MTGRLEHSKGFTLVEAVIVAVAIVVLLAVTIPWMRERQRERLQAQANTEPWEVFELRAKPAKEVFSEGEDILIHCEVENLTSHPLALPKGDLFLALPKGNPLTPGKEYQYLISAQRWSDSGNPVDTSVAPGSPTSFEARVSPFGLGATDAVIVYFKIGENRTTPSYVYVESQGRLEIKRRKRFQSSGFQLLVEAGDASTRRTFDEILAATKQRE